MPAERSTGAPGPPRILHVDDNPATHYLINRVLREAGFAVEHAYTGNEGLRLARTGPDVVLLDVKLPDIDGFEITRRLRADPGTATLPIVQVTATYATTEYQARGLDAGADGYLTHPVEPTVLVATINTLLRARRAELHARQEARLWQATFDAVTHGIAVVDPRGHIVRCNRAYAELVGKSCEELTGISAMAPLLADVDRRPDDGWPFERVQRSGRRERLEFERDGRWFETACDPIFGPDGTFEGTVRSLVEITSRKQVEVEAHRAREEAERANRLKDEFLATLSHELRTPLHSIVGWTAVLRAAGAAPENAGRAIEAIERSARAQAKLVEELLDVSRIVTGKLQLTMGPVELAVAVRHAAEAAQPGAAAKGVALTTQVEEGLTAIGDGDRIEQVVGNLLSNALKFTPAGGRVELRLARRGGIAEIAVADTGTGISPEFLPYVFDRFRQGDASSSRSYGGLGLGLSIVRHLVELHGGQVDASSPGKGHGATFTVRLPLAGSPGLGPGELTAAQRGELAGHRLLVVEDERDTRELVAYVLRRAGAEVATASDAAEGWERFQELRPDLIVSDIGLPAEDGNSLMRRIRGLPADAGGQVPALALSAYARAEDRESALAAGFQEHVIKPVAPTALVRAVVGLLRSPDLQGGGK